MHPNARSSPPTGKRLVTCIQTSIQTRQRLSWKCLKPIKYCLILNYAACTTPMEQTQLCSINHAKKMAMAILSTSFDSSLVVALAAQMTRHRRVLAKYTKPKSRYPICTSVVLLHLSMNAMSCALHVSVPVLTQLQIFVRAHSAVALASKYSDRKSCLAS